MPRARDRRRLCADLSVNGVRGWFLPSRDELALMYKNLKAAGLGDFRDGGVDNFTYWASSQQTIDMAVHIDFADLGACTATTKISPDACARFARSKTASKRLSSTRKAQP